MPPGPAGPRLAAVGPDTSRTALEVARAFARHLGVQASVCCGGVFALPFPAGTLGIDGIEAMSIGRSVISFDAGGQREWLDDGLTGLAVRPATAEALADAIRILLADPIRCRWMGEVGRERAERLYPPDVHVQRLPQVFARAAA